MLAGLYGCVRLGYLVRDLVATLAAPGSAVAEAGRDLSGAAAGGGDRVGDLPVVGDALAAPFEALAGGGRALADAGLAQEEAALALALWLGLAVALLPALLVLALWLPGRVRWIREVSAAAALRDSGADLRLFALRALVHRDLRDLRRAAEDPWAAYSAGDHKALAEVELSALGLRSPDRTRRH